MPGSRVGDPWPPEAVFVRGNRGEALAVAAPAGASRIAIVDDSSRRWWHTAKTPKQGFILGGLWAVLAVVELVFALGGAEIRSWLLAAGFAVWAVGYLVPAAVMRRR